MLSIKWKQDWSLQASVLYKDTFLLKKGHTFLWFKLAVQKWDLKGIPWAHCHDCHLCNTSSPSCRSPWRSKGYSPWVFNIPLTIIETDIWQEGEHRNMPPSREISVLKEWHSGSAIQAYRQAMHLFTSDHTCRMFTFSGLTRCVRICGTYLPTSQRLVSQMSSACPFPKVCKGLLQVRLDFRDVFLGN